jgi:hypothetical protein
MVINMTGAYRGGEHSVTHDLNFANERYEAKHVVVRLSSPPDDSSSITN